MMRINQSFFIILAFCFSGCAATKEAVYWEKKKDVVTVHHVRRTRTGTSDRTEQLTAKTMTPAEVHVYDLGRLPDGKGGMHEAHQYYRVVQSESFDLRLPDKGTISVTKGPKNVFTPPTYSPPPKSQRINDAVASAEQAKEKLDEARGKIESKLADDNNLRGEIQQQNDQIQALQEQINAGLSISKQPAATAGASPSTTTAESSSDQLKQWGAKIKP